MDFQIDHLDCHYIVSSSQSAASVIQSDLNRIATDLLTRELENHFRYLSASDPRLFFIEQVTVDLALDITPAESVLARRWAEALHDGVVETMALGGSAVTVFKDRGEFLASFVGDLLRGSAWQHWYYREFERLRYLSPGQAISQLLCENGDTGRDALLEIARRGALNLLMNALSNSEIEAITATCLLPPSQSYALPGMYSIWVESLRRVLSFEAENLTGVKSRDIARLYLSLFRLRPELGPDVNLARFIRDLLELWQAITKSERRSFLKLIESGDWARASGPFVKASERRWLGPLIREAGANEVVALFKSLEASSTKSFVRKSISRFGGLFLLAPVIAEMELHDFLTRSSYPEPEGYSKASFLLFLIGLQCLGPENMTRANEDDGLRLFTGLRDLPGSSDIEHYAEALTPETHADFARELKLHEEKTARFRPTASARGKPPQQADDSAWFSLWSQEDATPSRRELARSVSWLSKSVLQRFAFKLGAFAESSPQYLSRNVFESNAEITFFEESILVDFLTCPLQMVLRMAGFDHTSCALPWLEDRRLEFRFN